MGEIRCGKRRILSVFALHKNSAFEIHTTVAVLRVAQAGTGLGVSQVLVVVLLMGNKEQGENQRLVMVGEALDMREGPLARRVALAHYIYHQQQLSMLRGSICLLQHIRLLSIQ